MCLEKEMQHTQTHVSRLVYLPTGVSSGEAEGAECGTHDSSEGVEGAELGR